MQMGIQIGINVRQNMGDFMISERLYLKLLHGARKSASYRVFIKYCVFPLNFVIF